MNQETNDDPRLVLAVLNSLGVVGVNAVELKAFMKALKIYRKEKERYNEQWKEETKIKLLLQQGYFKNHRINFNKENVPSVSDKKSEHHSKPEQNDYSREILKQQSFHKNKFLNAESATNEKISSLMNEKKPKHKIKPIHNNFSKEILEVKHFESYEENNIKTKVDIPSKNGKDSRQTPSTEKLELHREPSAKSQKSVASSVISSNKSCRKSIGLKSSKKIGSDPVTLYNQYRRYWSKLSFPGEESHSKLRWAVREKMLGSQPNPRPR